MFQDYITTLAEIQENTRECIDTLVQPTASGESAMATVSIQPEHRDSYVSRARLELMARKAAALAPMLHQVWLS